MKKTGRKSPEIPEDRRSVPTGTLEATPEEKRNILRARAKSLAQEPERKGEAEECLEALAFRLAHETYAIETQFIREVYPLTELTPLPCTPDYIFGIINIRGQILTIIDMKKFFDLPEKGITNLNRVIVVWNDDMELGILADEIIGIRNIPEKGLNPPPPTMTGIHAGYIKGVTEEGLILLDMQRFLNDKTVSPAEIPASHRCPIGWQPQNNAYACLEMTDGGCGIEDKDIQKLFDPFFTTKFTGRGLGLAVVLGIVKAHGGAVTVESETGRGSTVRVFFPVSAEAVPLPLDKTSQPLAIEGGGTVLLVEDEEMVREIAAAMLTRLGFTVLAAKDGVEAVEVFLQHRDQIRLVLSDLTMPRMDGWEMLTALRKLAPDIPVILASGYDKAQVMAGDHPELPQIFLGKPYRLKELGGAISQALVHRKQEEIE